jgi:hypothetical protein
LNKFYKIFLVFLLALATVPANLGVAKAVDKRLPQVMVGQASVSQESGGVRRYSYGGMTGNEAILNYNKETVVGFDNNTTAATGLAKCLYNDLKLIPVCFTLSVTPKTNAVKSMKSRTKVNGVEILEVSTLLYNSKLIVGDVFSGTTDISNFAFWGRNLAQSNNEVGITDAQLKISGYAINNDAQSAWLDNTGAETTSIETFKTKVGSLASNGTLIPKEILAALATDNGVVNLYLQGTGDAIAKDIFQGDAGISPDGKVWVVDGDLQIGDNKTVKYYGLGTIVIKGNLVIGNGAQILPNNENSDYLGLMVTDQ